MHELKSSDLQSPDAGGLRERLSVMLEKTVFSPPVKSLLNQLKNILDSSQMNGRAAWIEERQDGTQFLQSVPEFPSRALKEKLFDNFPTTLLIPPKSAESLTEIIPKGQNVRFEDCERSVFDLVPIDFEDRNPESILKNPQAKKIIMLLPSRRLIEEAFVKYTEQLEEKGITLICQNLSGGLERMQAEFTAAPSPCIWMLTPWTYELVTLPPETAGLLAISSLPFDHPGNFLFSKRSLHYRDSFSDYSLPRLEHRLFRLIRTFCRHKTSDGRIAILDKRLTEKKYGERIKKYLEQFAMEEDLGQKKPSARKKTRGTAVVPEDQMALF